MTWGGDGGSRSWKSSPPSSSFRGQDLSRSLGDFFQAPKVISTGDELERKLLPPKEGRHPDLFSKR